MATLSHEVSREHTAERAENDAAPSRRVKQRLKMSKRFGFLTFCFLFNVL